MLVWRFQQMQWGGRGRARTAVTKLHALVVRVATVEESDVTESLGDEEVRHRCLQLRLKILRLQHATVPRKLQHGLAVQAVVVQCRAARNDRRRRCMHAVAAQVIDALHPAYAIGIVSRRAASSIKPHALRCGRAFPAAQGADECDLPLKARRAAKRHGDVESLLDALDLLLRSRLRVAAALVTQAGDRAEILGGEDEGANRRDGQPGDEDAAELQAR